MTGRGFAVEIITLDDVESFTEGLEDSTVKTMIDGANARAVRVAPCLLEDEGDAVRSEAKLILLGAIKRWAEAGSGAVAQASAGPFQLATDTRQRTGYNLWPSEITALQELCSTAESDAFQIDTVPSGGRLVHADTCSLVFGAAYCSCGAVLTQSGPLWGEP